MDWLKQNWYHITQLLLLLWPPKKEKGVTIDKNSDEVDLDKIKGTTRILFIDDEKFKVSNILAEQYGWVRTKWVKDVISLDSQDIQNADIIFIDINRVGTKLGFLNGLGLVEPLKGRYPKKKVVVYSANPYRNMSNPAIQRADGRLKKYSTPFEFQDLIETFAKEIYGNK